MGVIYPSYTPTPCSGEEAEVRSMTLGLDEVII
jgi:hypothetical protein